MRAWLLKAQLSWIRQRLWRKLQKLTLKRPLTWHMPSHLNRNRSVKYKACTGTLQTETWQQNQVLERTEPSTDTHTSCEKDWCSHNCLFLPTATGERSWHSKGDLHERERKLDTRTRIWHISTCARSQARDRVQADKMHRQLQGQVLQDWNVRRRGKFLIEHWNQTSPRVSSVRTFLNETCHISVLDGAKLRGGFTTHCSKAFDSPDSAWGLTAGNTFPGVQRSWRFWTQTQALPPGCTFQAPWVDRKQRIHKN